MMGRMVVRGDGLGEKGGKWIWGSGEGDSYMISSIGKGDE